MAEKDPVAAAAQKYKPIQSAVPGTTLGPIQINAFLSGGVRKFAVLFSVPEFLSSSSCIFSFHDLLFLLGLFFSCFSIMEFNQL